MDNQEVTAEFDVQDLLGDAPPSQPQILVRVTLGAKTDLGRARENNEDKFDWLEPEDDETLAARGKLYAVADGMGGHAAGQIASEVALKTLIRTFYAGRRGDVPTALAEGIRAANTLVWETGQRIPGRSGMGTTITSLALHEGKAIVGQVGDSRAYLIRAGEIEQITEDHSWVAEQVRAQVLTEEEAERSPYRNIITRSIGADAEVSPDLFETPLRPGDHFLLCSDGLTGVVQPEELKAMTLDHSPSMAAMKLIELANERGGPDNITCLIVRIDGLTDAEGTPVTGETQEQNCPVSLDQLDQAEGEVSAKPSPENLMPEEDPSRPKSWFGWKR